MADIVADGMTRVDWVPAIASQSAPTTVELNAGIALTLRITPDGLEAWEASTAGVDNSSLGSTHDTSKAGRDSLSGPMLRFKAATGSDTVKTTLTRGTEGFIVIRRDVAYSTAWASSDAVEVYPVECGRRRHMKPEANSLSRFEISFFVHTPPSYDAVVA